MLAKQAKISNSDKPNNWSDNAVDFINKLLIRKQNQRLGYDRPGSAKNHPWFEGFDWDSLYDRRTSSPFLGIVLIDNFRKLMKGIMFILVRILLLEIIQRIRLCL